MHRTETRAILLYSRRTRAHLSSLTSFLSPHHLSYKRSNQNSEIGNSLFLLATTIVEAKQYMGQGEETKTRPDSSVEIQERGEIFFFYRPKVEREEVHGADDVQRLFLVLRPESGERPVEQKQDPQSGKEGAKRHDSNEAGGESGPKDEEGGGGRGVEEVNIEKRPLLRFVVMGRKSLPDPSEKSRPYWGFVEMVTTNVDHVKAALKGGEYDTATRGHRHQPDCRAAGEGVYRILRHNAGSSKMHTHLVYKVEFPRQGEEAEPQEALNIAREASYLVQIKNPEQHAGSQFRGLRNKRKATFPAHLQGQFGQRRYTPADPPDFLNYEGCEFLLISASGDIEEELGLELKTEEAARDGGSVGECSDLVKMFGENAASTRPLFEGTWA